MKHRPLPRSAPSADQPDAPTDELYRAVLALPSIGESRRFFADLCTPAELEALADRWVVAQLLDEGIAYREIHDRTGVSTATITRVGRCLRQGEGGYRAALDRQVGQSEGNDS